MPKLIKPLTALQVTKAKPMDAPFYLRDGGGLKLLVRPTGTKSWQYDYKFAGKPKTLTLGTTEELSLDEARDQRTAARKLVKVGIDPLLARAAKKQATAIEGANTFEHVARDWLSKQAYAPKHSKNVLSRMEKDVFKHIGHPMSDR